MPGISVIPFPFSAVYGMEDAKRALMCATVDPGIRTVLIRGRPGTAKSLLARSFGPIAGRPVVNVPPGISDEQLFGGLDAEASLRTGAPQVRNGLLARADGGILCADDVNLMDRRTLTEMLDCIIRRRVELERDGVSSSYPCDTLLVATMDPEFSDLSAHLLDRFDLCAYPSETDPDENEEILRRAMEQSDDPEGFSRLYAEEDAETRELISYAGKVLPLTTISDELMRVAVELTEKVGAEGFRGDIAMVRASKAIAALNRRDIVSKKDVEEAAMICLAHRRDLSQEPPSPPDEREDEPNTGDDDGSGGPKDESRDPGTDGTADAPPRDRKDPENDGDIGTDDTEDMLFEIGRQFRVIDYTDSRKRSDRRVSSVYGRRSPAESRDGTGCYCRSRIPEGRPVDIALDATVRAAAPHQRERPHSGLRITVEDRDVRVKVRERRSGCTVLFLVDASGSLGVRRRMSAVKGAVLSMLKDSYVKRDSVGMMAFRRDRAELLLPPTRSVEYSYRMLEDMPTGGKTPLSEALLSAQDLMTSYTASRPGQICYVVLMTDGRANVPVSEGMDPFGEALEIAGRIAVPDVRWIVVDTSSGYVRFDNARRLAEALEAAYFELEDLDADRLADSVRSVMG